MEYQVVNGKKANSKIIFVIEENQVYLKKNTKSSSIVYVSCYFDTCEVTGKIENENFFHTKGIHCGHNQTVTSLILEWEFYNDLRKECNSSKDSLKNIFDNIYMK